MRWDGQRWSESLIRVSGCVADVDDIVGCCCEEEVRGAGTQYESVKSWAC